jgi:hypothetical protein
MSELFRVDNTAVIAVLATAAILSGIGFLIGDTSNSNYTAIIAFAPSLAWALWFFVYGIEKLIEVIFSIPPYIKALNSLFGMWLWNYIVLSFLFFDKNPSYPLEYTLIAPLVIEVWFLTSLIYVVNTRKELL